MSKVLTRAFARRQMKKGRAPRPQRRDLCFHPRKKDRNSEKHPSLLGLPANVREPFCAPFPPFGHCASCSGLPVPKELRVLALAPADRAPEIGGSHSLLAAAGPPCPSCLPACCELWATGDAGCSSGEGGTEGVLPKAENSKPGHLSFLSKTTGTLECSPKCAMFARWLVGVQPIPFSPQAVVPSFSLPAAALPLRPPRRPLAGEPRAQCPSSHHRTRPHRDSLCTQVPYIYYSCQKPGKDAASASCNCNWQ